MKLEIQKKSVSYEINLEQFTQLCGMDIQKKKFIMESLCKHFSSAKYTAYEEYMQDNIRLEGKCVGRKYFSSQMIKGREDIISTIKLTKSSLMMKYLMERFNDFDCQQELGIIAEHLERLYLEINSELSAAFGSIELGYEQKSFLDMIQSSVIFGREERALEELTDYELVTTYLDLIQQMQERRPEKLLVCFQNIDHMLEYREYKKFVAKIMDICKRYDIWCIVSTSLEGFVVLDSELLEGITVVNDILYTMPEEEQLSSFLRDRYPCQREFTWEEMQQKLKYSIHRIGQEGYQLDLLSEVFLKLINDTICVPCGSQSGINPMENSFLLDKNVV